LFGRWLEREGVFSWLMVAPPVAFLVALVGYPFFYGILISMQDRPVAKAGVFIGFDKFLSPIGTTRCSGRWWSTPSSTPSRDTPERWWAAGACPGDEPALPRLSRT